MEQTLAGHRCAFRIFSLHFSPRPPHKPVKLARSRETHPGGPPFRREGRDTLSTPCPFLGLIMFDVEADLLLHTRKGFDYYNCYLKFGIPFQSYEKLIISKPIRFLLLERENNGISKEL